ncbi:MAG: winged helix DNA-binding protein [Holophagaceae bacterium]|nr:winged helix DNA-binding protein [Holophagaceae bacterium]
MDLRKELHITKALDSGHEVALSILLTREYVGRLFEVEVFKPSGLTDQQYNLLRILKGGPEEGYLIKELRCRMIYRFADVPRLVDRLLKLGLVEKRPCPKDRRGSRIRITAQGLALEVELRDKHAALCRHLDQCLTGPEQAALLATLEKLRDDYRSRLAGTLRPAPARKPRTKRKA